MTRSKILTLVCTAGLMLAATVVSAQTQAACTFHYFTLPHPAVSTNPNGINQYGNIVGSALTGAGTPSNPDKIVGFIRYASGGDSLFTAPGATQTSINRRSATGVNVGVYTDSKGHNHGFALSGSSFSAINFPGASDTAATGINKYGTIVGWEQTNGSLKGFRLSSGHFMIINPPGAVAAEATGINDKGQIVGWYQVAVNGLPANIHGFIYQNGVYTTIHGPNDDNIQPNDISNTGEIVGTDIQREAREAFIYKNGGFEFIAPSAGAGVGGINSSNVITGTISRNNQEVGYTATCQ